MLGESMTPLATGIPSGRRIRVIEPAPGDLPSPRLLTNNSPEPLNARQQGRSKLGSVIILSSTGMLCGPSIEKRATGPEGPRSPLSFANITNNVAARPGTAAGKPRTTVPAATIAIPSNQREPAGDSWISLIANLASSRVDRESDASRNLASAPNGQRNDHAEARRGDGT